MLDLLSIEGLSVAGLLLIGLVALALGKFVVPGRFYEEERQRSYKLEAENKEQSKAYASIAQDAFVNLRDVTAELKGVREQNDKLIIERDRSYRLQEESRDLLRDNVATSNDALRSVREVTEELRKVRVQNDNLVEHLARILPSGER